MTTAEFIIAIVCAVFASTGFWTFVQSRLQKRDRKNDAMTKLMLGIAHEMIMEKSNKFINQGYILKDEYGDFEKYLYKPYLALGGNGTAEKIVEEQVKKLNIIIA